MDKNYKLFLILGIIIILIPFLGFREIFTTILLFIVGVILVVVSLMFRATIMSSRDDEETIFMDSHVEESDTEVEEGDIEEIDEEEDEDEQVKEIEIEIDEDDEIELKVIKEDDESTDKE